MVRVVKCGSGSEVVVVIMVVRWHWLGGLCTMVVACLGGAVRLKRRRYSVWIVWRMHGIRAEQKLNAEK